MLFFVAFWIDLSIQNGKNGLYGCYLVQRIKLYVRVQDILVTQSSIYHLKLHYIDSIYTFHLLLGIPLLQNIIDNV